MSEEILNGLALIYIYKDVVKKTSRTNHWRYHTIILYCMCTISIQSYRIKYLKNVLLCTYLSIVINLSFSNR